MSANDKAVELDAKTLKFFCGEFRKFIDGIEAMAEESQTLEEEKPEESEPERPVLRF